MNEFSDFDKNEFNKALGVFARRTNRDCFRRD